MKYWKRKYTKRVFDVILYAKYYDNNNISTLEMSALDQTLRQKIQYQQYNMQNKPLLVETCQRRKNNIFNTSLPIS